MQRLAPVGIKVRAAVLFLPVALDEVMSGDARLAREDGDNFVRTLATIKRLDERLNDADRSIVGAGITPGLEIVRLWNVPLAKFAGLVAMRAQKYL